MQSHPTLFSQITSSLFASEFSRSLKQFPNAKPTRGLTEYDPFLALCFGQLTYRESLRDIVGCLNAKPKLLYHLGFRGRVTRTNLAYANRHRDWRLFQCLAETLMRRAASLYRSDSLESDLPNLVFALDSSIISLALNLFPWGHYARTGHAALKLHILLSLKGNLPAWAVVTEEAHVADLRMLDEIPIHPGAFYVMDRGYMDFVRLYRLHQGGAFLVVRCKEPVSFKVMERRRVDTSKGFRLFKWIKQHLRLRTFYGRSANAVRCQIWCAICAYLQVAILKKQIGIKKSMNEILPIVSVTIFEQTTALEILASEITEYDPTLNRIKDQNCFEFRHI